jgi:hypothetical protein
MATGVSVAGDRSTPAVAVMTQRLTTVTNASITTKASPSDKWLSERRAPSVFLLRSAKGRWGTLYHKS